MNRERSEDGKFQKKSETVGYEIVVPSFGSICKWLIMFILFFPWLFVSYLGVSKVGSYAEETILNYVDDFKSKPSSSRNSKGGKSYGTSNSECNDSSQINLGSRFNNIHASGSSNNVGPGKPTEFQSSRSVKDNDGL